MIDLRYLIKKEVTKLQRFSFKRFLTFIFLIISIIIFLFNDLIAFSYPLYDNLSGKLRGIIYSIFNFIDLQAIPLLFIICFVLAIILIISKPTKNKTYT